MTPSKNEGRKRSAPECGLYLECEADELSQAQNDHYERIRKAYLEFNRKIEEYNKAHHGKTVIEDLGVQMIETLHEPPPAPVPQQQQQQFTIIQLTGDQIPGQLPGAMRQNIVLAQQPLQPKPTLAPQPKSALAPLALRPAKSPTKVRKDGRTVYSCDHISEAKSLGGLSFGSKDTKTSLVYTIRGDDDAGIALSKTSEKTYPSLMFTARPKLNPKVSQISVNQSDRSVLDGQVKGLLMLPAGKFCEWLLQQGLVRKSLMCPKHPNKPLELIKNNNKDPKKFVFTGGLVWYGDCCKMTHVVSVFYGSMFESSPHPPSVILKLIYHWACQTNTPNVLQWVKVDPVYLRNFYCLLRAVCVLSIHTKLERFGGIGKEVEVAVGHFYVKDDNLKVLAILDVEAKRVRFRSFRIGNHISSDMTNFLKNNVVLKSTICCGESFPYMDILEGFPNLDVMKGSNATITTYLREVLAKFSPANVSISAVIFQQFLDELAWRERWGPSAMSAFNSIVKHISEYTNETPERGIIKRLIDIAAYPFLLFLATDRKRIGAYDLAQAAPRKKAKEVAVDKALSIPPPPPFHSQIWRMQEPNPDMTEEIKTYLKTAGNIPVDSYYYGSIRGKTQAINKENALSVKCPICLRVFFDCYNLMTHLIVHFQSNPPLTGPLQRRSQCHSCFVAFNTSKELSMHASQHNISNQKKLRSCLICEISFPVRSELLLHMYQHHVAKELPYSCRACFYRTSSYTQIINHMKTHQWDPFLYCPYCLKIVKLGPLRCQKQNASYFAAHIRRHCTVDEERCRRCKLRFVHPAQLTRHVKNFHMSLENLPDVEAFPAGNQCVVMPSPELIKVPPLRPYEKPLKLKNFYKCVPNKVVHRVVNMQCVECEGFITPKHFSVRIKCMFCSYTTYCEYTMKEHHTLRHDQFRRPRLLFAKPVTNNNTMYCSCGYKSCGNDLANHLVDCNETTAYTTLLPMRKDELTVLNTVGLVRKSPEPAEKTNNAAVFKQGSFLNIVSVESLRPASTSQEVLEVIPAQAGNVDGGKVTGAEKNCDKNVREIEPSAGARETHGGAENTQNEVPQEEIIPVDDVEEIFPDRVTASIIGEIASSQAADCSETLVDISEDVVMVFDKSVNSESINDEAPPMDKEMESVAEVMETDTGDPVELMEVSNENEHVVNPEVIIPSGSDAETVKGDSIQPEGKTDESSTKDMETDIFKEKNESCDIQEISAGGPDVTQTENAETFLENVHPTEDVERVVLDDGKALDEKNEQNEIPADDASIVPENIPNVDVLPSNASDDSAENIPLPDAEKTESDKPSAGSLIEELEDIINTTENTIESNTFISE